MDSLIVRTMVSESFFFSKRWDWIWTGYWALFFLVLALVPDEKLWRYKFLGLQGVVVAGWFLWAAWTLSGNRLLWLRSAMEAPLLLYFFGTLFLYGISPQQAFSFPELRRVSLCVAVFFLAFQSMSRLEKVQKILWIWIAGAGVAAAYGVLQRFGGMGPVEVPRMHRVMGTFGNPIFFAAYLVPSLATMLGGFFYWRFRKTAFLWWGLFLIQAAGFWFAQTRAAWIGLGLSTAAFFLLFLSSWKKRLAALGFFLGALGTFVAFFPELWQRPQAHLLIWRDTLQIFLNHPWTGCGLGRFHLEFPQVASAALRELWPQERVIINFAHNEFLQVLAEGGLWGLGLVLWVLWSFATSYLQARRSHSDRVSPVLALAVFSGWVGMWGGSLFSVDMRFDLSAIFSFWLMGALQACCAPNRQVGFFWTRRLKFLGGVLCAFFGFLLFRTILFPYQASRRALEEPEFFEPFSSRLGGEVELLEAQVRERPQDPAALERLAYRYAKLKEWEKAIAYYRRVLELSPQRPGPYNNLANILYTLGRVEPALELWRRSVAVAPNQVDAHLNLGLIYYRRGELKQAGLHLEEVLRADPKNEKATVLLKKMVE
ncbi:MAG: tetratricopeptide repeat protein [Elusimicrobia bacterium]|nr:tetratricopeptide repeat protein [Elusimicrobiota bacterium]